MAGTTETLPPGGAGGGKEYTVTDERSAGDAIAGLGLLDIEDDEPAGGEGDTPSGAEEAPETGTEETPPTGEDDEGQSDTRQAAPIEPPKSWTADERAEFSKLPPAMQATIARREGERDQAISRHVQEIADAKKAHEAERATIDATKNQYVQSLNQLVALALPEAKQFENVDWVKLSAENPAEYVRLNGLRDALRGRVAGLQNEIARVTQEQQHNQAQQTQAFMGQQKQLLVERLPEFGDAEKGPKLARELGEWLQGRGFSQAEVGSVLDHRLVMLGVAAMRAEKADAARKAAQAKQANTAPNVQPPGTTSGEDGNGRQVRERAQRLVRSGSTRDAASILEAIL
jgi:hypothetical protein